MGDSGSWLYVLGGGAITAVLGILWWILSRTDRAIERSNTAIAQTNRSLAFAGSNMALVEALRTAIYMQGQSLDGWEDWGVDVKRLWRSLQQQLVEKGAIDHVEDLPVPPGHLDLTAIFANIPKTEPPEPGSLSAAQIPAGFFDKFLRPGN